MLPDAVIEPFPQATDAIAPHAPEKSWRRGFAIDVVIVIVGLVLRATNLYQTSFLLPIPHMSVGIAV
jgi:hypothetical protein